VGERRGPLLALVGEVGGRGAACNVIVSGKRPRCVRSIYFVVYAYRYRVAIPYSVYIVIAYAA